MQPSQALLDRAYAAFATLAEVELQQVTGSSCKVGCRARLPRLVRKSFGKQGPANKFDPVGEARQFKWLKGRALELEALLASRESAWRSRLAVLGAIVAKNPPSWLEGAGRAGEWHKWLCVCMHSVTCIPESAEPALPADFVLELARLASDCDRAVPHDSSTRAKEWADWARASVEGSAGRGHKFTKVPQAWVPSTEVVPPGGASATPAALLEGKRRLWSDLWTAGGGEHRF